MRLISGALREMLWKMGVRSTRSFALPCSWRLETLQTRKIYDQSWKKVRLAFVFEDPTFRRRRTMQIPLLSPHAFDGQFRRFATVVSPNHPPLPFYV